LLSFQSSLKTGTFIFTAHCSASMVYTMTLSSWQRYCMALVGCQPNCGIEQRRHLYSARRPSRWALAHILVCICDVLMTERWNQLIFFISDMQCSLCDRCSSTQVWKHWLSMALSSVDRT